jgi:hypothetical protein
MIELKQGEDLVLQIPVIDDSNSPVDVSSANKIRVSLFVNGTSVKSYLDSTKEAAIAGYGDVTVNVSLSNLLDLNIVRADSSSFPIGAMVAYILVDFPDGDLTNKRVEYSYTVGTVIKGSMKDESLA